MEITKISAATFGGSPAPQPAEQGFVLIYLSMLCHSLKNPYYGWDGRIRTCECWDQNPVPYHLATSQYSQDHDDYNTLARKNPQVLV